MASLAELAATNYRLLLRNIRDNTLSRVDAAYADVTDAAILDSYGAFVPTAAQLLTAAQAASETLTAAYVAAVTGAEPEPTALAGLTKTGQPIAESLPTIGPMILGQIGAGADALTALLYGRYLVGRFVDNEISRVADTALETQAKRHAIGWRGITYGPSDACAGNAGFHPFSVPMYRHGSCRCERVIVMAADAA